MLRQLFMIGLNPAGEAQAGKFNTEGALLVSGDAGAPTNGDPIVHLDSAQTKNQEDEMGTVALEQSKTYGRIEAQILASRDALIRLAWVSDNGGTPVETTIGYGFVGPGRGDGKLCPSIKEFTTTGTGDQVLKIYATPLDNVSDMYANVSAYKLD